MAKEICRHCGVGLVFAATKLSGNMWRSEERYKAWLPFSQYCWIGSRHTSRCHEPMSETSPEADFIKEVTQIWEKYDHTKFNQQSVVLNFAREIRDLSCREQKCTD